MWGAQVEGLSDIRRVLAPDLDGHGGEAGKEAADSMDEIARRLAARLDAEGVDVVDLGGFSMGGYVSFAFLRLFPERVRSLALVDTKSPADTPEGREGRDALAAKIRDNGAAAAAEAMLPKMFTDAVDPSRRTLVEGWILEQPPASLVADVMAMKGRPDSTPTLAQVSVPTVVIVGEADPITPPTEAQAMVNGMAGAHLVTIPGAAHLAPVEQAEEVTAALRAHLGG
jgi:pimeloyl-ACP methyl ester carboxylesterase